MFASDSVVRGGGLIRTGDAAGHGRPRISTGDDMDGVDAVERETASPPIISKIPHVFILSLLSSSERVPVGGGMVRRLRRCRTHATRTDGIQQPNYELRMDRYVEANEGWDTYQR